MGKISRRTLLGVSSGLVGAAAAASALPLEAARNKDLPSVPSAPDDLPEVHRSKKLKVVFVGAHTDDYTAL